MVGSLLFVAALLAGQHSNSGWSANPDDPPRASRAVHALEPASAPAPAPAAAAPAEKPAGLDLPASAAPGPPVASPGAEGWPDKKEQALQQALEALNARRRERVKAGSLQLDENLTAAAQEHADALAAGKQTPHQGFPNRVRSRGWIYRNCGIRNAGFGNISEGIAWGGQTPSEAILILDGAHDPREGHRQDFEDPAFTHVGIGFARMKRRAEWVTVVDYGARCDAPAPRLASRPSGSDAGASQTPPQPPPLAQKPAATPRKVWELRDDAGVIHQDTDPDQLIARVARANQASRLIAAQPVALPVVEWAAAPATSIRYARTFEPYGSMAPYVPAAAYTSSFIPMPSVMGAACSGPGCGRGFGFR